MVIGQLVSWPVIHSFIYSVCLSVVSLMGTICSKVGLLISLSVSLFFEFSQSFSIGTCHLVVEV